MVSEQVLPAVAVPVAELVAQVYSALEPAEVRDLEQEMAKAMALTHACLGHEYRLLLNFCQTCILYFYL